MKKTFAELGRSGHGCRICGDPTVAQVGLTLRKLNGHATGGKQLVSRTRSLCEHHAVAAYEAAEAALKEMQA